MIIRIFKAQADPAAAQGLDENTPHEQELDKKLRTEMKKLSFAEKAATLVERDSEVCHLTDDIG